MVVGSHMKYQCRAVYFVTIPKEPMTFFQQFSSLLYIFQFFGNTRKNFLEQNEYADLATAKLD